MNGDSSEATKDLLLLNVIPLSLSEFIFTDDKLVGHFLAPWTRPNSWKGYDNNFECVPNIYQSNSIHSIQDEIFLEDKVYHLSFRAIKVWE